MKLRKSILIASLSAILLAEMSGTALVFAENIPDQQVITAQDC